MAPPATRPHNDDIEILRAYAIGLVLYEHLNNAVGGGAVHAMRQFATGWTGVDLFFCISGFVIYGSLWDVLTPDLPRAEAARRIVAFWVRRFWRLAPTLGLWVVLGLGIVATDPPREIGPAIENVADAIASLLGFENLHRYACAVSGRACGTLYAAFWSLSLEAQFYLVLPVAMVCLPRRWLLWAAAALIAVQFPLRRPANAEVLAWFLRTDALAWGILLAALTRSVYAPILRPTFLEHRAARAALTLGCLLALMSSPLFWRDDVFVGVVAALSAVLVWAASYDRRYVWRGLGGEAALRWIGTRSYSIYVIHLLAYKFVREVWQSLGVLDFAPSGRALYIASALTLTFAAAELNYRSIEMPLRRRGRATPLTPPGSAV